MCDAVRDEPQQLEGRCLLEVMACASEPPADRPQAADGYQKVARRSRR